MSGVDLSSHSSDSLLPATGSNLRQRDTVDVAISRTRRFIKREESFEDNVAKMQLYLHSSAVRYPKADVIPVATPEVVTAVTALSNLIADIGGKVTYQASSKGLVVSVSQITTLELESWYEEHNTVLQNELYVSEYVQITNLQLTAGRPASRMQEDAFYMVPLVDPYTGINRRRASQGLERVTNLNIVEKKIEEMRHGGDDVRKNIVKFADIADSTAEETSTTYGSVGWSSAEDCDSCFQGAANFSPTIFGNRHAAIDHRGWVKTIICGEPEFNLELTLSVLRAEWLSHDVEFMFTRMYREAGSTTVRGFGGYGVATAIFNRAHSVGVCVKKDGPHYVEAWLHHNAAKNARGDNVFWIAKMMPGALHLELGIRRTTMLTQALRHRRYICSVRVSGELHGPSYWSDKEPEQWCGPHDCDQAKGHSFQWLRRKLVIDNVTMISNFLFDRQWEDGRQVSWKLADHDSE